MLLQYCVRLLQEFEDRLDFKCNLREVSGKSEPFLFCENIHTHLVKFAPKGAY